MSCNCNEVIKVKFAKVKDGAKIPSKKLEDAGYDIYACFDEDEVMIESLQTKMIPSGIASAVPNTHYFQLQERGSTGTKGIKYGAGVIDSGYRGEWMIPLTNCDYKALVISKDLDKTISAIKGCFEKSDVKDMFESFEEYLDNQYTIYSYDKAIAQAILLEVPRTEIEEISYEELKAIPSERGTGKLGSSGK